MSDGGDGDWSESLFNKSEKEEDSLGGSWGRKQDEPDLTPVAWDQLPEAPKNKPRARLATPAPGSQKESGLLDIKALAPSLAKGINEGKKGQSSEDIAASIPPSGGPARLATEVKGSRGSGLIDVQEIVQAQEEQADSEKSGVDAELEAIANNASASMSANALSSSGLSSSSLTDQPVLSSEAEDYVDSLGSESRSGQGPILVVMAILAVAVAGLAYYVLSQ